MLSNEEFEILKFPPLPKEAKFLYTDFMTGHCTLDLPASASALLLVEPPHVAPQGVLVAEGLAAELAVNQLGLGLGFMFGLVFLSISVCH